MLTVLASAGGPGRGIAAEQIAARRLVDIGYEVELIGGRNRGHDLIATRDTERLLVDCKALTLTSASERKHADCGTHKIYCRGFQPWSNDRRTHLALVALPEGPASITCDDEYVNIAIPVAGSVVFLVPIEDMNLGLEPDPTKAWLWLDDDWVAQYRL